MSLTKIWHSYLLQNKVHLQLWAELLFLHIATCLSQFLSTFQKYLAFRHSFCKGLLLVFLLVCGSWINSFSAIESRIYFSHEQLLCESCSSSFVIFHQNFFKDSFQQLTAPDIFLIKIPNEFSKPRISKEQQAKNFHIFYPISV